MVNHSKKWILWEINEKFFFEKSFENVFEQKTNFSYDFYYSETFNFEFSNSKCIYEMSECVINENDTVVDLGSNVGFFTYYAATKSKNVISVEGSPELFSCLVKNTRELNNVKYLNANIVSNNNSDINVWSDNPSKINIRLDELFDLFNIDTIDFLKVDIEGGEYNIFEDLDQNVLSKIKKIAIETHANDQRNDTLIKKINKNLFSFDWYLIDYKGIPNVQKTLYFY